MATKNKAPDNVVPMSDPAPESAPKWQWPENKETRMLEVVLNKDERIAIAETNAKLGEELDPLDANRKASASRYKAQIEDVAARVRLNNTYVSTGRRDREVKCEWLFEIAGFDSSGDPIEHPDKKTLVRTDTGEAVEVRDITDSERQAALPLEDTSTEPTEAAPVEVGDDE